MAENFFLNVQGYETRLIEILKKKKTAYDEIEKAENNYINSFITEIKRIDGIVDTEWRNSKTAINKWLTELKKEKKDEKRYAQKANEWTDKTKNLTNENSLNANELFAKLKLTEDKTYPLKNVSINFTYSFGDPELKMNIGSTQNSIDTSGFEKYTDLPKTVKLGGNENIVYPFAYIYIYDQFRKHQLDDIKDEREKFKNILNGIFKIIENKKTDYTNLEKEMKEKKITTGKYKNGATYVQEALDKGHIEIPNIEDDDIKMFNAFLVDFMNDLQTKEIKSNKIFKKYNGENAESLFDFSDCEKFIESEINTDIIGTIKIPKPNGKVATASLAKNYVDLVSEDGEDVLTKVSADKSYYTIYEKLASGTLPNILTKPQLQ